MGKKLRSLLFVGLAYTVGWNLSGWMLFSAAVGLAAVTALLLAFQVLPDSRLPSLEGLDKRERFQQRYSIFRTSFFYGVLFFYGLGLFAGFLNSIFS